MDQIILVCGKWIFEKNRWKFHVDQERGSRVMAANDGSTYEDFIRMVIEDYKVEWRFYDVELSYMVPKKMLAKLPQNTPPVIIDCSRQYENFQQLVKSDHVRLCVELKERTFGETKASSSKIIQKGCN